MADKKMARTLSDVSKPSAKKATPAIDAPVRGSVQTVRMGLDTLKALKYASIERGISQNDIMLAAIRRDLGLG